MSPSSPRQQLGPNVAPVARLEQGCAGSQAQPEHGQQMVPQLKPGEEKPALCAFMGLLWDHPFASPTLLRSVDLTSAI